MSSPFKTLGWDRALCGTVPLASSQKTFCDSTFGLCSLKFGGLGLPHHSGPRSTNPPRSQSPAPPKPPPPAHPAPSPAPSSPFGSPFRFAPPPETRLSRAEGAPSSRGPAPERRAGAFPRRGRPEVALRRGPDVDSVRVQHVLGTTTVVLLGTTGEGCFRCLFSFRWLV